jgi:diguanylate cyclase (GGDEF)-like protein
MEEYKPRVLVVDDEKINRTVLLELLKADYTVVLAKSGKQALDKAHSEHPPDLILMDIMMPGMDGYTACQRLKESPLTRDIPVIFVTAMQDAEDECKGLDTGAIDYIAKPFSPAIVLARVRNHLALEHARKKLAEAHAMLAMKNKELKTMAAKDFLTGLSNRFTLDETMNRELHKANRYDRSLSVAILDVDHFKTINDTHGHQVGDLVLKKLAVLLRENVRDSDVLGRWGGEEFLVICPETDAQGIFTFAENMRKRIETYPFPTARRITVSLGLATFSKDDTVDSIIRRADNGLYRAKNMGRNRVETG